MNASSLESGRLVNVFNKGRVAVWAAIWVIRIKLAKSHAPWVPAFDRWVRADREHWVAYVKADEIYGPLLLFAAWMIHGRSVGAHLQHRLRRRARIYLAPREVLYVAMGMALLYLAMR